MPITESLYVSALQIARPLLPLLARGSGKLARGIRGRRGVLERMERWAREERDPARPLVWFHAPSVGEGLQARAVMEVFRARRPDVQVAYTFFSPSAEGFAATVPTDFHDYLPLDLPGDVRHALELLRPEVIAFSKTDVWPVLTREAKRRGIRLALLSGTLPESSSRLSGAARALLRPAYTRLDRVAAISPADAERFGALGVPSQRRTAMGDARFDQVWKRAGTVDRGSDLLRSVADPDRLTLVAGSTWPPDEERLIPAVRACLDAGGRLRLVLVPHEPAPAHLAGSGTLLERHGLSYVRLSSLDRGSVGRDVLLVDRVGILGDLYAVGHLAYVGGGFGTAGLHSVLEPAAFGLPVLFGPGHANAREAGELVENGGAWAVKEGEELARRLLRLLSDEGARRAAGARAREYVEGGLGAAERGAEVVEELLRR
ncbi:MAG TPA: glycosyltransferase N-terminal domain-containing protein [Longimicrobiaceae bacterium]|nr:glycosyltransferase N-terminal domain-containing protein [Longimicrobiaceae bacterium]